MATRSEEIEREIEQTRRDMTRTVGAIEQKLSPDGMIDGAVSWLRTNPRGRAMVDDVTEVVARNPLPLVLIGIGVGWLAWEMTRGGRRTVGRYRPMRDRLGPNFPAERHHMHVEDGGSSAYGRAPDADDLLGHRRSGHSAREAAEAFRDMDRDDRFQRPAGGNGSAAPRGGSSLGGSASAPGSRSAYSGSGAPGAGYGPSVSPGASSLGSTGSSGGTSGSGTSGTSTSSPDPEKLTGYQRSGERAADAAKAFQGGASGSGGSADTNRASPGADTGRSAAASTVAGHTPGASSTAGAAGVGSAGTTPGGPATPVEPGKRYGGLGSDLPGSSDKK